MSSSLPPLPVLAAGAAVLGVASHLGFFIHGEHDLKSRTYVVAWAAFQTLGFVALTRVLEQSLLGSVLIMTTVSASYLAACLASIAIYRLFFHRLNRFPGPFMWKLTKWAQVFANAADSHGYLHLDELHRKYGPIVRIGPNELSLIDPAAAPAILGPGTKCTKAIWYDVGKPLVSMHQCRDKKLHDIRRRTWDKGFGAKALRDYESRVSSYSEVLMDQMAAFGGKAFNASKWFNYYSFDVMGDLAFGESFQMLNTGEKHFAIPLLEKGMEPMNIIPAMPWLFWLLTAVPALSVDYDRFIKWSGDQAERRKAMKVDQPDIMSHLLSASPMSTSEAVNKQWEIGDARLIIVAGSDTTAATLTFCMYELLKHPEVLDQLRAEVKPYVDASGHVTDHTALQSCQFLNTIIDEALRLHPPVPSGLNRISPPEGMEISGTYIPASVHLTLPLYSIQRNADAYAQPDEFIPERWSTKPALIKQKGAFAPFSLGAFSCVGKNLAYMEIRTVLAMLVTRFDVAFGPGEDGSKLISGTEDHFTLNLGDLHMTCTPRKA